MCLIFFPWHVKYIKHYEVLSVQGGHLLFIPQSFDWLAAFYLELLKAILFIAV
jgi:hypothetical protein